MKATQTRAIDALLDELEMEAPATRRVLERIPADKLDWRPHAKSWTLGQLALHVAKVPGNVAAMSKATVFPVDEGKSHEAQPTNVSEILGGFEASLEEARAIYGGYDDATAQGDWSATFNGNTILSMTRLGVIRMIGLNHWYHHRGQLMVYLRLLNVPLPPVYGPTADENPFA